VKRFLVGVFTIVFLFSITGCALIFKTTKEEVKFDSEPAGAQVIVNGTVMGTTPCAFKLESKGTYMIEIRKEGHAIWGKQLTNHVGAGWIILDILGGLVPIIIDAATGAWYQLDEKSINAVLIKQQPRPLYIPISW
jgi:hypothetical protein